MGIERLCNRKRCREHYSLPQEQHKPARRRRHAVAVEQQCLSKSVLGSQRWNHCKQDPCCGCCVYEKGTLSETQGRGLLPSHLSPRPWPRDILWPKPGTALSLHIGKHQYALDDAGLYNDEWGAATPQQCSICPWQQQQQQQPGTLFTHPPLLPRTHLRSPVCPGRCVWGLSWAPNVGC
jgi:hypothetical protein